MSGKLKKSTFDSAFSKMEPDWNSIDHNNLHQIRWHWNLNTTTIYQGTGGCAENQRWSLWQSIFSINTNHAKTSFHPFECDVKFTIRLATPPISNSIAMKWRCFSWTRRTSRQENRKTIRMIGRNSTTIPSKGPRPSKNPSCATRLSWNTTKTVYRTNFRSV